MQLHGILQGYQASNRGEHNQLGMFDIYRLNADGAIQDYMEAFSQKRTGWGSGYRMEAPDADSFLQEGKQSNNAGDNALVRATPRADVQAHVPKTAGEVGRCSALVRLVKDSSEGKKDGELHLQCDYI
jgi:hypothetical protein